MANKKVVIAGSNGVTAQQISDFFRQIIEKSITDNYIAKVLKHFEGDRTFMSSGKTVSSFQLRTFFRLIDEKKIDGKMMQSILEKSGDFEDM